MVDAYGPIFTLKLGMNRALVVNNWEIAKECLITNDKTFAFCPKLAATKHMRYDNSMFGFSQYDPLWRHMRKMAHRNFSQTTFQVQSSIKKLYELCVNNRNKGSAKVLVEMKTWFGDLTLNTILMMMVGKQLSTGFDGSADEQCHKALREFFELFGTFVPSDSFPFLKWLDLGGYERAMKTTAKVLDEVVGKWLREQQQRSNSSEVETEEQDFMDLMLSTF